VSRGADSDYVRPLGETPEILTHKVMSHRYSVPDPCRFFRIRIVGSVPLDYGPTTDP
jgi:hypothetical protein